MPQPSDLSPELQKLCEDAAQEQDPQKLRELTERINSLLDQRFSKHKGSDSKEDLPRGGSSAA